MLVRNNALLFAVNNPAPVLEALPKAKLIRYKNRDIIAVRHTLDSAKVLNNLGLNAPSPVLYEYRFTGRYTPTQKQTASVEFFTLNNRGYCFNQMRTGKTSSALWALDYLKNKGEINRVLVISPLQVMEVWVNETFTTLPHRNTIQLLGNGPKRVELARQYADIHIINFDGIRSLYHEEYYPNSKKIKRKWNELEDLFDLIIVDEASAYCNAGNWRWKALKQIIKPNTKVWLLTGTPTNNAPTDSYGLLKLIQPEKVPHSFTLFEEHLMRPVGPYKKVPRDGAEEYVFGLMQPAIRFLREANDALPTTTQPIHCVMSKEQEVVFKEIKEQMLYETQDVEITAANAAVKLVKLQQIMCGAVKDVEGNPVELNPKDRLKQVATLVENAQSKTVVFVPYIHSMHMVANYLESLGYTTAIINGRVSKTERDKIISQFKNNVNPHVLIAHPKVAAHGLDLTCADTFIWFAPTFSVEQYEQANARGEGPNKSHAVGIYHIGCHPLEWRIYDAVKLKKVGQDTILDMYNSVLY